MSRYFTCECHGPALRVSTDNDPEWDCMALGLEFIAVPYRWTLRDRLKAAWRAFWKWDFDTNEIWLTRKKALALAEYILDGLGHEIDIEKRWREVDALLPEGLPVSVKERIKLRSAGNKVVIKIMLGEVYKGISVGMTTEDICRMLGRGASGRGDGSP